MPNSSQPPQAGTTGPSNPARSQKKRFEKPHTMTAAEGIHWAEEHAGLIVGAVAVFVLCALAYAGMQFMAKRQERAAQDEFYSVAQRYQKTKDGFEQARFKEAAPKDAKAPAPKTATGDLKQDYGSLVDDLEKIAREHAGTTAGAEAAILAGDTYLQYKQPEKAVELARLSADKLSDAQTLKHLSNMLLGNALATKGDCQEAVSVWQKVLDNSKAAYLHADASLRAGLCYEKLGQTDKALEMYRKASSTESAASTTARGLLRALEVKSKPGAAPETKG